MILNEQLNNTVWQIEASELAYDATQRRIHRHHNTGHRH